VQRFAQKLKGCEKGAACLSRLRLMLMTETLLAVCFCVLLLIDVAEKSEIMIIIVFLISPKILANVR
jgi:hypothetical protein